MWFVFLLLSAIALRNGSLEDLDGDGKPDGWTTTFREVRMVKGVKGSAVECIPDKGKYWSTLVSPCIAVKRGQKFDASVWLKGEGVSGVHVKFHFLDSEGKRVPAGYKLLSSPLSARGWAFSSGWSDFHRALPVPNKSGSWDWEQWRGSFEIDDPHAEFVRLEVWVERKGGKLFVDEANIQPARPMEKPQKPLSVERKTYQLGKLSVELLTKDDQFLGLGRITLGGVALRSGFFPWKILLFRLDGAEHEACLLEGVQMTGGRLRLRLGFKAKDGGIDRVVWELSPATRQLGGREFSGVRSALTVEARAPVLKVLEAFSIEPDGRADGLKLVNGQLGSDVTIKSGMSYRRGFRGGQEFKWHPGVPRWGAAPFFEFVQREGVGTVVCYLEKPALVRSALLKPRWFDSLLALDYICLPPARGLQPPPRFLLLTRECGWDLWAALVDELGKASREHYGLLAVEPMPAIQPPPSWKWKKYGGWLELAKELGFKRIGIWTAWFGDRDAGVKRERGWAPWFFRIRPALGGEEWLADFCDAAHGKGIDIFLWLNLGHLAKSSPLVEANPEWVVKNPDGTPYDWGYPDIVCLSARSGWGDYALRALRTLRDKTGVDGFWLDSHWNFGLEPINYAERTPVPQFDRFVEMEAELMRMGYFLIVESRRSPFGLSGQGADMTFSELAEYPRVARFCYKTSPMVCATKRARETLAQIGYFKLLSFKATPIIFFHDALLDDTPFRAEVARANKAYNRVHDLMDIAHILPDDAGVEWFDRETRKRVIWTFRGMKFRLERGETVSDVLSGKIIARTAGEVPLPARGTFLIASE